MNEIDRRWRRNRDTWTGLSSDEHAALSELLAGPENTLDATQPAIARQLFFLFAADETFSTEKVLPLFVTDDTSRRAWHPFLIIPRYNDKLLAAGLLTATIKEWDRIDSLNDDTLRDSFYGLTVSIISFASIKQDERQKLLDKSVLGGHASEFSRSVVRFVSSGGVNGSEIWNVWLRDHLAARLNGLPRTADMEELMGWADSIPYLGQAVPEAMRLIDAREIGLSEHFLNPDFPPGLLTTHGSELVGHYARRIRNSDSTSSSLAYQISELIEALHDELGDAAVQPLIVAASKTFPGAHF